MVLYIGCHREHYCGGPLLFLLPPTNICMFADIQPQVVFWILTHIGNAARRWQIQAQAAKNSGLDGYFSFHRWPCCLPNRLELGRKYLPLEIWPCARSIVWWLFHPGSLLSMGSICWTRIPSDPHATIQEHTVRCQCGMRELRSRRLLCQHSDLANNDQLSLHYGYQEDGMAFCKLTI